MAARAILTQAGSVQTTISGNAIRAAIKRQLYSDIWPWTFTLAAATTTWRGY